MPKLNQVIAIEKGVKNRVISEIDQIDKAIQKPSLFDGFTKVYKKRTEDEEDVPTQRQNVQLRIKEVLKLVADRLGELLNVTAQKDYANCAAKGDVEVDGLKIASDVPATHLLFIEKQLTDLHTLVGRIPVLDQAEVWSFDSAQGLFRTDPTLTSRTKKVQRPLVLYPHSAEHPAQTQIITEDITVGTWELTKFSGAIPDGDKKKMLGRIEKLLAAVKYAREAANTVDAEVQTSGTKILDWLFQS